jgi:phosphoribosyl-ATP pyrophosphohydrolase
MRWFDVGIAGRYNGKPREVKETVQARDPEEAVRQAVVAEFDHVCRPEEVAWNYEYTRGKLGLAFSLDDLHDYTFHTEHISLEKIVTEVTDPVRLAKLTGAPTLPLDLSEGESETAAPRPMWFTVNLEGLTANDRTVRHRSTRRAATADAALKQALEEVFDVPCDGAPRRVHQAPGIVQLIGGGGGVVWPLWVKDHLDIVREAEPPTWATPGNTPDAYQRQALATWGSATDSPREQRLHALLGLVGEAGEVANLVKKQLYKPGVVDDNAAVIDELADVAYYLAVLASLYGVTFDGLFAHLAGKLAGGHGWLNPSNSTGLEVNGE